LNFLYCERISIGLFGEPLNIITNSFFLLVAYLIYRQDSKENLLLILIALIGIGSFFFHAYPSSFTGLLDIFFIISFMFTYSYKIYKYKFGYNNLLSYIFTFSFILLSYFFGKFFSRYSLGVSCYYFVIVLHLILIYFLFRKISIEKKILQNLYFATLIFIISLVFRTLDQSLCNVFNSGTHFLWHILNSIVLFLLVKFYILLPNRTTPKKPSKT